MTFPNAYRVEIVQVTTSAIATFILLWALYDASKDASGLRAAGQNGPRTVIARGNVLRGLFRLLMSFFFVVSGVASVLLPPPPDFSDISDEAKLSLQIVRIMLIASTGLLLIDAFVERWFRRKFVRALKGRGPLPEALFAPPPGIFDPTASYPDPMERRKDAGHTANPVRRSTDEFPIE